MNNNIDFRTVTGQGFIDRVINHFINEVMQRLDVGTADVHTRPSADGLQAFKDLDIFCAVGAPV